MLDQHAAACLCLALRHVPLIRQRLGNRLQPLLRAAAPARSARSRRARVPKYGLEQGHRGLAALLLDHMVQHGGERLPVPPGEEGLAAGAQTIDEHRRADPAMHPLMADQTLQLQLLQMVPHGVEREIQSAGQILGGELPPSLELQQHGPTLATLA